MRQQTNLICGSTWTRASNKLQEIISEIEPENIKQLSKNKLVLDDNETFYICVGNDSTRGRRVDRAYVDKFLSIEFVECCVIPCLTNANPRLEYGDEIEFY